MSRIAKLDKNIFYEQLKKFSNKYIPIFICMPINMNSNYSIILDEFRTSTGKITHDYTLQIYDRQNKKYMCKDITFNLLKENITSDYQLYKFVNNRIGDVIK